MLSNYRSDSLLFRGKPKIPGCGSGSFCHQAEQKSCQVLRVSSNKGWQQDALDIRSKVLATELWLEGNTRGAGGERNVLLLCA